MSCCLLGFLVRCSFELVLELLNNGGGVFFGVAKMRNKEVYFVSAQNIKIFSDIKIHGENDFQGERMFLWMCYFTFWKMTLASTLE